jgi:excisionase family DNA binding protein
VPGAKEIEEMRSGQLHTRGSMSRSVVPEGGNNHHSEDSNRLVPMLAEILARLDAIHERVVGTHKELYTVEEVAELTGRAAFTVRRWVKEGRIEATRVAGTGPRGRLLIAHNQLQRLISMGMGSEVPPAVGS